jgi:hypothetical protein
MTQALTLILAALFFFTPASAEEPLNSCKPLDFSSYHRTESIQKNLIRSNPQLKTANFNKKFLVLRNDYLLESAIFVADCETGKFIKSMLDLDLKDTYEVQTNSDFITVHKQGKLDPTTDQQLQFNGSTWKTISKTTQEESTTKLIAKTDPCIELDFQSTERSRNQKKSMMELNPDRSRPNFNQHYLLLKNEAIFETYWLIADCRTGKFAHEILTGDAEFNLQQPIVTLIQGNGKTQSHYWIEEDEQWLEIRRPERPTDDFIKNKIHGFTAKKLLSQLDQPKNQSTLRFENIPFKLSHTEILIKSGKCDLSDKKPRCEIEI